MQFISINNLLKLTSSNMVILPIFLLTFNLFFWSNNCCLLVCNGKLIELDLCDFN